MGEFETMVLSEQTELLEGASTIIAELLIGGYEDRRKIIAKLALIKHAVDSVQETIEVLT